MYLIAHCVLFAVIASVVGVGLQGTIENDSAAICGVLTAFIMCLFIHVITKARIK